MSEWRTEEEAKANCIAHMGKPLGVVFHELWAEIVWLSDKLNQYVELYGEQKRVDILNMASPDFFRIIQVLLGDDILLHIARLTDERRKDTLTIDTLRKLVDNKKRKEVGTLIEAAKQSSEFARVWRNKRIAHLDFNVAIDRNAESLPRKNLKAIKSAISAMSDVRIQKGSRCGAPAGKRRQVVRDRCGALSLGITLAGAGESSPPPPVPAALPLRHQRR